MTSYTLNPNEAREGSGRISQWITDTGAYVGSFSMVYAIEATTGTKGIEFVFQTGEKQEANFRLYTQNKEGKPLDKNGKPMMGHNQLQAIMTILKLRGITGKIVNAEVYDHEAGKKVHKDVEVFPELMNKGLGIVFQMEEYRANNGGIAKRPLFFAPYDPVTRKLAIEILDSKPAGNLDKMLKTLKDRPLRERDKPAQAASQNEYSNAPLPNIDNIDDIPF